MKDKIAGRIGPMPVANPEVVLGTLVAGGHPTQVEDFFRTVQMLEKLGKPFAVTYMPRRTFAEHTTDMDGKATGYVRQRVNPAHIALTALKEAPNA